MEKDKDGELTAIDAVIAQLRSLEAVTLEAIKGYDSKEFGYQFEVLRAKQEAARARVRKYLDALSPLAAHRYMALSHDYGIQLHAFTHREPLSDKEMRELAGLKLSFLDSVNDMRRPKLKWSKRASECRSNGQGVLYQGIVELIEDKGPRKQVWGAYVNPFTMMHGYPAIQSPTHFYSADDAKVWAEKILEKLWAGASPNSLQELVK